MILDKIQAYGFTGLSIVLVVLLGIQSWRLHSIQVDYADAKTEWANNVKDWAQIQTKAAKDIAEKEKNIRERERVLIDNAFDIRKTANEKVNSIRRHSTLLIERMRVQQAPIGGTSKTILSCAPTASENRAIAERDHQSRVSAELREKLVHEAVRADTIRVNLVACYEQYNSAQQALAEFVKSDQSGSKIRPSGS